MSADLVHGRRKVHRDLSAPSIPHPGLWLDRFLAVQTWEKGREPEGYSKDEATHARDKLIDAVAEHPAAPGYSEALQRWRASFAEDSLRAVTAEGRALGRVILGLGAKGVGEFGISLHHTWGVPVLPGSSLKGIAAVGAHRYLEGQDWRRRPDHALARAEGPNLYDALFGDVEEQGAVIFHDAWFVADPETKGKNGLYRDVLTVHHPTYYQKDGPWTETDSPIPVPFVSAAGRFFFALELAPNLDPVRHGRWLKAAWIALQAGLLHHGIGSKTNSGYGRFQLDDWEATSTGKTLQAEIERQRKEIAEKQAAEARAKRIAEREALATPEERVQHVLQSEAPGEGAVGLWNWIQRSAKIDALPEEKEVVQAAARALAPTKPELKSSHRPQWKAWISEVFAAQVAELSEAEIRAIIERNFKRPKNGDKEAIKELKGLKLGPASLEIARRLLLEKGVPNGKLKDL